MRPSTLKRTRRIRRRGRRRFRHAVVNPAKLAWVRCQPCRCAATDGDYCEGRVEPHHEGEPGERSDDKVLPLCGLAHHREGPHSRHVLGPEGFEAMHNLSLSAEVAAYEQRFQEETAGMVFDAV